MTAESEASTVLPMHVRLELVHCLVQRAALLSGTRVLHMKGVVAAQHLGLVGRRPVDVDVWASPDEVGLLIRELEGGGWVADDISPSARRYRHAAVLTHPLWGCSVDVHHRFPGIGLDPAPAFEEVWSARDELQVAGWRLSVPSRSAHALVVLLHAARGMGSLRAHDDLRQLGSLLGERDVRDVVDWAVLLECPPGAAGLATSWLDAVPPPRAAPAGAGVRLWLGRVRAARGLGHRAALVRAAVLPDRATMSARAGARLGHGALVRAWWGRWAVGLRDLVRVVGPTGAARRMLPPPLADATTSAAVMPVRRREQPAPSATAPVGTSRLAWRADGADLWVARLDTGVVRLLNVTGALVWKVARPFGSGASPDDDIVVAGIATLLGVPAYDIEHPVRETLARLRAAGLMGESPVTNGASPGLP